MISKTQAETAKGRSMAANARARQARANPPVIDWGERIAALLDILNAPGEADA
jgi:hypothetical protein